MTRSTRLLLALLLNLGLVVGQVVAGMAAGSTGLLSDAGHNLTDAASVALSLMAVRWAMRPRSDIRTFGNSRGTILAALINAAVLAVVTVVIVAESIRRLIHPVHVDAGWVVVTAGVAIVVNGIATLVLDDHSRDLNTRSAMLHMASDVLSSACVLVASLFILVGGEGWERLDPVSALVVALIIILAAVRLTRESIAVLLESTPPDVDLVELRRSITSVAGVDELHDLHVWSISSELRSLSAHLVLSGHPTLEEAQEVAGTVRAVVEQPFEIAHTTFELECERCADEDLPDPCGADGSAPMLTRPAGLRTRRSPE